MVLRARSCCSSTWHTVVCSRWTSKRCSGWATPHPTPAPAQHSLHPPPPPPLPITSSHTQTHGKRNIIPSPPNHIPSHLCFAQVSRALHPKPSRPTSPHPIPFLIDRFVLTDTQVSDRLCRVVAHRITSHRITSCRIVSCRVMSCCMVLVMVLYCIVLYCITSYLIAPHRIASHHIVLNRIVLYYIPASDLGPGTGSSQEEHSSLCSSPSCCAGQLLPTSWLVPMYPWRVDPLCSLLSWNGVS